MKVSDVFRQRMVHHRRRQDLTQAQLSERLVAMGVNLSRATVAEIESAGTRGNRVTLEEAVAITAALNVPLRVMLLPLTEGDKDDIEDYDIEIGNQRANVWKLQRWLRGDAASYLLPGGAHVWFDAARPLPNPRGHRGGREVGEGRRLRDRVPRIRNRSGRGHAGTLMLHSRRSIG